MTFNDLRRLKALEAEERGLKQILAEQALDNLTLKEFSHKTPDTQDQEAGGHIRSDQSWAEQE